MFARHYSQHQKAKLWRKNAFRCLRTERGKRRGTKLWIRLKYLRTTKLCLTLEVLNILLSLNETVGIETMALLFKLSPELTTTSTSGPLLIILCNNRVIIIIIIRFRNWSMLLLYLFLVVLFLLSIPQQRLHKENLNLE